MIKRGNLEKSPFLPSKKWKKSTCFLSKPKDKFTRIFQEFTDDLKIMKFNQKFSFKNSKNSSKKVGYASKEKSF